MTGWLAVVGFYLAGWLGLVGFFFPVSHRGGTLWAPFAMGAPDKSPVLLTTLPSCQATASGWAPARTRRTRGGCTWTLRRRGMTCTSGSASSACWRARSGTGAAWPRSASTRPPHPPSSTTPTTSAAWWPRSSKVRGAGHSELCLLQGRHTAALPPSSFFWSNLPPHLNHIYRISGWRGPEGSPGLTFLGKSMV